MLIRTIFETDYGDSDLNGQVDFDDYAHIDNGFNNGSPVGRTATSTATGSINFDDYALIDLAFNSQDGSLARAMSFLDGSDPARAEWTRHPH